MATSRRFAPFHPWDRNFFLAYVVLIWLAVVMGFGPEIAAHLRTHEPPYPFVIHVHAVAFVGWLVLLTFQVLLIRTGRLQLHRTIGIAGAMLAGAMIVLGPLAAVVTARLGFGGPNSDPSFLSVQSSDILAFATLVTAGLVLRDRAAAHKRLILLATLYISDAGFARWLGGPIRSLVGHGVWPDLAAFYGSNDLLILLMGAYDLVTRRRLHLAYVLGVIWIVALEITAVTLYHSPQWRPLAAHLLGH